VTAFTPTVANLQGYAEAVREKTLACLNTLTPEDLHWDLAPPGGGDARKVGARLAVILLDHLHPSQRPASRSPHLVTDDGLLEAIL